MKEIFWKIPPSNLEISHKLPQDKAVVVLLRHSVRDELPPGEAGYLLPITEQGHRLASELGNLWSKRLRTLRASPLLRCVQTAEALREGAGGHLSVSPDKLLGDPGAFVLESARAGANWERLGHEEVMAHLVGDPEALPGMAKPDEAARFLVQHMLAATSDEPGLHVFVTHDSLVTATAARMLGKTLGSDDWPWYLEGAFFWREGTAVEVAYREHHGQREAPLCSLSEAEVIELARREIAWTLGLDSGARFFLAGGAFKSLLTGKPPRDLDLWAPSETDRNLLLRVLHERGAKPLPPRPFGEAFELRDRVIEVPHKYEPASLQERLDRFDIALSAVGVEFLPDHTCKCIIHPLAKESERRKEILLLKPLVNWRHALTTLERMRRYAAELHYSVPREEEAEVWRVFQSQSEEMKLGMMERFRRSCHGGFGVEEELGLV